MHESHPAQQVLHQRVEHHRACISAILSRPLRPRRDGAEVAPTCCSSSCSDTNPAEIDTVDAPSTHREAIHVALTTLANHAAVVTAVAVVVIVIDVVQVHRAAVAAAKQRLLFVLPPRQRVDRP